MTLYNNLSIATKIRNSREPSLLLPFQKQRRDTIISIVVVSIFIAAAAAPGAYLMSKGVSQVQSTGEAFYKNLEIMVGAGLQGTAVVMLIGIAYLGVLSRKNAKEMEKLRQENAKNEVKADQLLDKMLDNAIQIDEIKENIHNLDEASFKDFVRFLGTRDDFFQGIADERVKTIVTSLQNPDRMSSSTNIISLFKEDTDGELSKFVPLIQNISKLKDEPLETFLAYVEKTLLTKTDLTLEEKEVFYELARNPDFIKVLETKPDNNKFHEKMLSHSADIIKENYTLWIPVFKAHPALYRAENFNDLTTKINLIHYLKEDHEGGLSRFVPWIPNIKDLKDNELKTFLDYVEKTLLTKANLSPEEEKVFDELAKNPAFINVLKTKNDANFHMKMHSRLNIIKDNYSLWFPVFKAQQKHYPADFFIALTKHIDSAQMEVFLKSLSKIDADHGIFKSVVKAEFSNFKKSEVENDEKNLRAKEIIEHIFQVDLKDTFCAVSLSEFVNHLSLFKRDIDVIRIIISFLPKDTRMEIFYAYLKLKQNRFEQKLSEIVLEVYPNISMTTDKFESYRKSLRLESLGLDCVLDDLTSQIAIKKAVQERKRQKLHQKNVPVSNSSESAEVEEKSNPSGTMVVNTMSNPSGTMVVNTMSNSSGTVVINKSNLDSKKRNGSEISKNNKTKSKED